MDLLARLESSFGMLRSPGPRELLGAWDAIGAGVDELLPYAGDPGIYPYGRKLIYSSNEVEILVMNWAPERECAPHDHGQSFGWVCVVAGAVHHKGFTLDEHGWPVERFKRNHDVGSRIFAPRGMVHSMRNSGGLMLTVHLYAPPITGMRVYDLERCAACVVSDDCGAWWPEDQRQVVREIRLTRSTTTAGA